MKTSLFKRLRSLNQATSKRWPYLPVIVSLCLGVGVSIAAYSIASRLEQQRAISVFDRRADDLVNELQGNLDEYTQITRLFGVVYESYETISADKFQLLSQKILPYNRGILAMGEIKIEGDRAIIAQMQLNFGEKLPIGLNYDLYSSKEHQNTIRKAIESKVMVQTRLDKDSNKFIIYRSIENEDGSRSNKIVFSIYDLQKTINTAILANQSNSLDFQLYNTSIDILQSSLMKPQLTQKPILSYDRTTRQIKDGNTAQLGAKCSIDREWFQCLRAVNIAGDQMSLLIVPNAELGDNGQDALLTLAIGLTATIALVIYLSMSVQLQKYYLALELANHELEDRVKQRTADLEKAKEVAEAAVLTKDRFLVNISHELRSPLNAVLGYANSMLNSRNLKPGQLLSLRIIKQSGNHLLSLINDILDFSKTQAAKIEISPKEVHLPSFLEEIEGMVTIAAKEKGIYFDRQTIGKLPEGIKADEKRLRQILLNLLGNAIKFTESGQVILRVTSLDRDKIRFEIIDTGMGIESDRLETIFQPFEQAGDENSRTKGTGLGLAISKQLVELMGSKIEVKSTLGVGSVFWFDLVFDLVEIEKAPMLDRSRLQIIGYKGTKRKILVVDDLEANRLLLRNILQPLGFDLVEAANGVEGLELARNSSFDLVLSDLLMPYKSGLMMILELRRIEDYKDVPIIALSASSPEIMAKQSKNVGCNDFLAKPIDEGELLALIKRHLDLEWVSAYFARVELK